MYKQHAHTSTPEKPFLSQWLVLILATTLLSLCLFTTASAAPTAQEIIIASDNIRNPSSPFSLKTVLIEYRNGQVEEEMTLLVYSKKESGSGRYRSLVHFMEPKRDEGKLMLKDGNNLWFYDPSSKVSIRISPEQRLLGQASNGDVVTVNFQSDYNPILDGQETITDADKQNHACYKMTLTAKDGSVTYHKVEYWVRRDNFRPVKGKFYSDSGRLLKTAYYRGYEERLGAMRPTEAIIIDGLSASLITKMIFSGHTFRDIPDSWFQKDYLPRFHPKNE